MSEPGLVHLVRQPITAQPQPPLLILLHGVGSNEQDLFQLAPQLDPRLLVVSARAPNMRSPGAYAWFEVQFTPQGPIINPAQAEASRQQLIRFIGEVTEAYQANPQRVYLMGFSQGAIMSASIALTAPELVAGAVLMSGRILPEIKPLIAPAEALRDLPVLLIHGTHDSVLPIQHGRASHQLLSSLPLKLSYHEFPIGHTISPESLATIQQWLSHHLDQ
ncbi:MAG: phospholipase [Roseiflexaceae bacterium]